MSGIQWLFEHHFEAIRQPREEMIGANRCIYCGAESAYLGGEHVWPDGLNGHLIVPKASCKGCEKMVNRFEQPAITVNFGLVRLAHGIRSAKKRQGRIRPTTYRAHKDGAPDLDLPLGLDMPQMVTAEAPGRRASIISGIEPTGGKLVRVVGATNPDAKLPAGYGVRIENFRTGNFSRLMAKVAHSYAIGALGIDAFTPLLRNVIFGYGAPTQSRYIGDVPRLEHLTHLNRLRVGIYEGPVFRLPNAPSSDGRLVIVSADIFTNLKLPTFEIIAGIVE